MNPVVRLVPCAQVAKSHVYDLLVAMYRLCGSGLTTAGNKLPTSWTGLTYASVVSRESIRIAFLIAAINGLDILSAEVKNTDDLFC
jgi:hypothetical protein